MESLAVDQGFWSGKRVFLTGHTGFKGSWLSLWLEKLGADVTGFALSPETTPNLFSVVQPQLRLTSIIGDIRDADFLRQSLVASKPDVVIHMAAQPLVRASYDRPLETYETNVMGTANLLNAVRDAKSVRSVVVVTTDKVYENKEWDWAYREIDALGGYDPYSSSKAASELVVSAYRNSFFNSDKFSDHGVAIATARAGNVFGGGDWSTDRLLPDVLRSYFRGDSPVIRNPDSIRPWQLVLEPLRGYLMLARGLYESGTRYSGEFNFGPAADDARPVKWIVERISEVMGAKQGWAASTEQHPHEAHFLSLDVSKAQSVLGWRPTIGLEKGLEFAIDWHQQHSEGADMRAYSIEMIDRYEKTD